MSQRKYFGTDGVRGEVGGDVINAEFALRLGYAAGKVLAKEHSARRGRPTVLIGKDTRISGYMLESALEAGFASAGIEVLLAGPLPTPAVAYLTRTWRLVAGIVISASHNPYYDNGIKFFSAEGLKLGKTQTQRIEAGLRGQIPSSVANSSPYGKAFHKPNMVNYYGHFLLNGLPADIDFSGMRIVLDLAWGASVLIAPEMFRVLGAEVICLHDQPNGDRINVDCGSTNLTALKQAVQEHRADIGFAFDMPMLTNVGKSYYLSY
jgi:phosphoglucosamine mutase